MMHRQLSSLLVSGLLLLAAFSGHAQDAPRPALLELPLSARLAGSAESMGAPLKATLGDVLAQPALLDTTHAGQLHLGYMDYFSGTAQAAAIYARRPQGRRWVWHTGLRNFGFGDFTARDPAGTETGQFAASDAAWVSGAAIPLDTNLTFGAALWLGQSTLADQRSSFSQVDLGLTYFRRNRQLRLAALWRPWGAMTNVNGTGGTGRFDSNLQFSLSKGFDNAPFVLTATYDKLQTWDISPEGLYDDTIDPLTGDTVANGTWAFGDRLLRHLAIGTELDLGNGLQFRFGYHHRRRQELRLNNAPGTAGFAWGLDFTVRRFQLAIARNTYHTAGASTHFAIRTRLTDR